MCRMIYIIANGQQNVEILFLGQVRSSTIGYKRNGERVSENIESSRLSYVNVEMLCSVKISIVF